MLGISIYLGSDLIEDFEFYIERVKKVGFSSIFTSLHIPEDDPQLYEERLRKLGAAAKQNNMELMADISSKSLGHLGFTWENAEGLLEWGLTGLRIDYGISETEIVRLSHKMKIALNASTLTKVSLQRLKQAGLCIESVEAWHNFYPRPETGLDEIEFTKVNSWLKKEGLTVMAFTPGDGKSRGPLYKGLPTLEAHRDMLPFAAFLDLINNHFVDKVLVGDLTLQEDSLEQFASYQKGIFLLRAEQEINDPTLLAILETVQTNRWDAARDCVRSMESREYGLIGTQQVQVLNTVERPLGTITVDNEKYERYKGEIQITKRDLSADEKVNVIGRITRDDRPLLSYLSGGKKFKIKWLNID